MLVHKEQQVHKVQLVLKELQVQQVLKVQLEVKEQQEQQVLKELKVFKD